MLASGRFQRWALILGGYDYSIKYTPAKELANADGLSQLPLTEVPSVKFLDSSSSPISVEEVRLYTSKDPTLLRIVSVVSHGWLNSMEQEEHKPYWRRKNKLSTMDGCLLWGSRVVVPPGLRERVLKELHQTHPGVVKMKALARSLRVVAKDG